MSLFKTLFLLFALIIILTNIIYAFDRTIRSNYIKDLELLRNHHDHHDHHDHHEK